MSAILEFSNPSSRISHWSCEPKERWLLTAPTGWGKSVWLKQLALLRDAESSEILWQGKRVLPADATLYRSRWISVSQNIFRSHETVSDHIDQVLKLKNHVARAHGEWEGWLRNAFFSIGLGGIDLKARTLHELSGGESQALALIRAVLLEPEGLFLDEPTSAMDRDLCLRIENWLSENFQGAWIWVTHDTTQADRLQTTGCKRVSVSFQA
jgi:ABC-type iron transport system FetAB ATPase subunit